MAAEAQSAFRFELPVAQAETSQEQLDAGFGSLVEAGSLQHPGGFVRTFVPQEVGGR